MDLLESLADESFRAEVSRSASCPYNSDEEEVVPELEKQEAELSMLMSQRWDSDIPGPSPRYGLRVFPVMVLQVPVFNI